MNGGIAGELRQLDRRNRLGKKKEVGGPGVWRDQDPDDLDQCQILVCLAPRGG